MDAHAVMPSDLPVDPLLGQVVNDRYRIVRKLGEGGMGSVYEGEHILIKRRVAIKCLHSAHARNAEVVARFHREALAATSIGNEHIIEVTDMGRFPDATLYLVLEYLDGQDLAKALESGPMSLGRVVHIASQVCEALSAAHAKGIVHRDLKPENVFLIRRSGNDDFVKVLDFGISKFKDSAEGLGSGMTRTGTAMGTPHYMAPEQVEGRRDVDHRVDLYALGVMLFRMLTGQHPFEEETFPMLVLRICTTPAPPVRMYRPDVPVEVENVILRMLAKNKDERFADCMEVRAVLRPYRGVDSRPIIARPQPPASPTLPGPAADGVPAASGVRATAPPTAVAQAPDATATRGSTVVTERAASNVGLVVAVLGLAVVATGIAIAAAMGVFNHPPAVARETPQPVAIVAPHEATPTTPLVPVGATPGVNVPGPTRSIHVRITTQPADAELLLDGARVANPFDAELPESATPRRLEVRAPGYTTIVQDLTLQYSQNIVQTLHRGQGVDDQRRARAALVHPSVVAPTPVAEPAAVPARPTVQESPAPAATPTPAPQPTAPTPAPQPTAPMPAGVVVPPAATPLHPAGF